MPDRYREWDIRPTWLDRAPFIYRHHQPYLPLYPLAVQAMDLRDYDVILSNKSGFCHGVRTRPEQLHIDYCLTPTRYVWDYAGYAAHEDFGSILRLVLRPVIRRLQTWDRRAADGVDYFVAISREVQARIARFYGRESTIIHPPVNTDRYHPSSASPGDYFLIVSRLIPYKRIDLAVQACNQLSLPLLIVGEGRQRAALEAMAGPTVRFLGRIPDEELNQLLARCRAFIFPGCEDFGIAPVEAQAAGRPVIAYAGGGALDTVVDSKTGLFFHEQTPEALATTIRRLEKIDFDPISISHHAQRFSIDRFRGELLAFIEEKWQEHVRNGRELTTYGISPKL
jgi:glycosyltransferase involved in cell wall biosynthesis